MKFSDIKKELWADLQPFLDTCLLPLTGLTGTESPWEVTESLERLRDVMDLVEIPFKGRVVTYPAVQYYATGMLVSHVEGLCRNLREAGFRYVILITADPALEIVPFAGADLLIGPETAAGGREAAASRIAEVWQSSRSQGSRMI